MIAPAGDRFNQRVELANVRAVATNYRKAGAPHLVLAGVVVADRGRYEDALGEPVLVCRLRPSLDRVQQRLMTRHEPGDERDWHLTERRSLRRCSTRRQRRISRSTSAMRLRRVSQTGSSQTPDLPNDGSLGD